MTQKLRFELKGKPESEGQITVRDFSVFLRTVGSSLNSLASDLGAPNSTEFRIADLSFSSAVIEIEAISKAVGRSIAPQVIDTYWDTVEALQVGLPLPKRVRPKTAKLIAEAVKPLKGSVASVTVSRDGSASAMTAVMLERAGRLGAKATAAEGQEAGFLDALNVHDDGKLLFYLYPSGFPERIECHFGTELLDQVRQAVKHYVTVEGRFLYQPLALFPSRIDVDRLIVHPQVEELPGLLDLVGAAPDLTGGMESVAYLNQLRDAEA